MRIRYIERLLTVVILAVGLVSCGGGSGSNVTPTATLPPVDRVDYYPNLGAGKLFGYFGDCPLVSCLDEYKDHVNLYYSPAWEQNAANTAGYLQAAQKADINNIVLAIPSWIALTPSCRNDVDAYLSNIVATTPFKGVIGVTWIDEPTLPKPNGLDLSAAEIKSGTDCVRAVLPKFNLPNQIWVIYGCHHRWDGIENFDVLLCDEYGEGDKVLTHDLPRLKSYGKPVGLVSGGACSDDETPWNHDPRNFATAISKDPQIIALIGFIWFERAPGICGIKTQPTLKYYRKLLAAEPSVGVP